jgi:hypothetical protein
MGNDNKIIISVLNSTSQKQITNQKTEVIVKGKSINAKEVDLVFVIDTTGSMSDKINGLLETCSKFVDEFSQLNLDYRIAIVAFGDLTVPGDKIEATLFTSNIETTKKSLIKIPRNGGGGNEGESSLEALLKAFKLEYRSTAVKVIILITDEPAIQRELAATTIIETLTKNEFLTFVISPAIQYFKDMAINNGGKWYQISATTDFSDLLDMFKEVAKKVTVVVRDVYKIGNGKVSNYLKLKDPSKD